MNYDYMNVILDQLEKQRPNLKENLGSYQIIDKTYLASDLVTIVDTEIILNIFVNLRVQESNGYGMGQSNQSNLLAIYQLKSDEHGTSENVVFTDVRDLQGEDLFKSVDKVIVVKY